MVRKSGRLDVLINNAGMIYVGDGIRVNSVHPDFIHTPLTDAQAADLNESVIASTPMKRGGQPIKSAYGRLFLASDEASYVTGAEPVIDRGYLALHRRPRHARPQNGTGTGRGASAWLKRVIMPPVA